MLNGDILRQIPTTMHLGIHIDQHLTWNTHIEYIRMYLIELGAKCIALIGLDLSLLRFYVCCIKHMYSTLCPFWIISFLSASNCPLFNLKLFLMERTFRTAVKYLKFFMRLLPLISMECFAMLWKFLDVLGESSDIICF